MGGIHDALMVASGTFDDLGRTFAVPGDDSMSRHPDTEGGEVPPALGGAVG